MILAAIPVIVTPLYAFYRVKKFKKGLVIIIALIFVDYFLLTPGTSIYDAIISETVESEKSITIASNFATVLILEILLPLYFARKWTIEYNEKIKPETTNST